MIGSRRGVLVAAVWGAGALGAVALGGGCGGGGKGGNGDGGAPRDGGGGGGQDGGGGGSGGGGQGGGGSGGGGGGQGGGGAFEGGGDAGGLPGDMFVPWEGGPAYWTKWKKGPPTDPAFFPIAVFWQTASDAAEYKSIGVNTYVTFDGASEIAALDAAGIYAWADQTQEDWTSSRGAAHLVGWNQMDEPDNAQSDGKGGYGPCVDPKVIQADYATFIKNDPDRPVYLSTGQGTAWTAYYGRGSACAGKVDMYADYAKGGDLLAFDIYPVNSTDAAVHGNLYFVAMGVDTLRRAGGNARPVWAWIETTDIDGTGHLPSPAQIRTEVWMALVHEARGFGYFCHAFKPKEDDRALLHVPASKAAVKAIDAEVAALAPVLNTPSVANWGTVASKAPTTPIDVMVKRQGGATYVFAVAMRDGATTGSFTLDRLPAAAAGAEVLGESRTVPVAAGTFSDAFDGYAVHLYRLRH